jgi:hypothetical protein
VDGFLSPSRVDAQLCDCRKRQVISLSSHCYFNCFSLTISRYYVTCYLDAYLRVFSDKRWLKAQGKLYPSRARLYLAPCTRSIHQQNEMFWKNYYGFDFSIFDSYLKIMNERKPDIVLVATNELLAPSQTILDIDLKTVSLNDLRRLKRRCLFVAERSGPLRSYCCWFDVIFEGTRGDRTKQSFSLLFSAICVFVLA